MKIGLKNKKLINSILEKALKDKKKKGAKAVLIGFNDLYKLLSKKEIGFCKALLKINPGKFGFKGRFIGIKSVPQNLVAVKREYLPDKVYKAYSKLNKAIYKNINKKILVDSCYRSPAYQLIIFLYYLKFHKYNFKKTAKRVALPGYSEHGDSLNPAIDFITQDGKPSEEHPLDFLKTKEYKWLLKNAEKFGFRLSYSKNNKLGIVFEPWHWRLK